jgi:hypothetical protein
MAKGETKEWAKIFSLALEATRHALRVIAPITPATPHSTRNLDHDNRRLLGRIPRTVYLIS